MQAEHAGTIVLFDGRKYYTLPNETAKDLWALLVKSRSADEMVTYLHERYDAPKSVIDSDVATLLEVLRRERLVLATGPDDTPLPPRRRWWQVWKERGP